MCHDHAGKLIDDGTFRYVYDAWSWNYENLHPGGVRFLRRIRNGEADFDRDVDLCDFAVCQSCVTGPVETDRLCDCRFLDLDHDRDVELDDFVIFQTAFTGEGS